MTDLSRRERKKQETREKLFTSAMQLFKTHGFSATSIEQITQNADVGKGTFYNYFPSKEAVVIEYSREAFRSLLEKGRQQTSLNVRDRLANVLRNWADFMVAEREIAWIAIRNREQGEFDTDLHYGLQAILTLGQRYGEISCHFDPGFLAENLEGMMLQHFISWYITREGNLYEEMEGVLQLFFDGLLEQKSWA